MNARLFDNRPERVERSRCRSLLPLAPDACLSCGGITALGVVDEPALFRHGGYGGTTRTVSRWCPNCKVGRVSRRETVNPRELAA